MGFRRYPHISLTPWWPCTWWPCTFVVTDQHIPCTQWNSFWTRCRSWAAPQEDVASCSALSGGMLVPVRPLFTLSIGLGPFPLQRTHKTSLLCLHLEWLGPAIEKIKSPWIFWNAYQWVDQVYTVLFRILFCWPS